MNAVVDVYSKSKRSEIMSHVKNKRTSAEETVAELLRQLGAKYRRNVAVLPGRPDFAVKSVGTVIFVNGCFWHGHVNCRRASLPDTNVDFWKSKIATNKKRDRRAAQKLRQGGWKVVTIWQCSLREPERVKNRLGRILSTNRLVPDVVATTKRA